MLKSKMIRPLLLATAVLFGASACASGGTDGEAGVPSNVAGHDMMVEVNNNLQTPTPVTIALIGSGGVRADIGTVSPNSDEHFRVNGVDARGSYRLVATRSTGEEITSREFDMEAESLSIQWNLSTNDLTVRAINS